MRTLLVEILTKELNARYLGKLYNGKVIGRVLVDIDKNYESNPNGKDWEYDWIIVSFEVDGKWVDLDLDELEI